MASLDTLQDNQVHQALQGDTHNQEPFVEEHMDCIPLVLIQDKGYMKVGKQQENLPPRINMSPQYFSNVDLIVMFLD